MSAYNLPYSTKMLDVVVAAIEADHLKPTLEEGRSLQWCYNDPVLKTSRKGAELGVVGYASLPKMRQTDQTPPATKTLKHLAELVAERRATIAEVRFQPLSCLHPLSTQIAACLR